MSDNIVVSIICNSYNHEKYIRRALDGFLMQKTSFPYEILIHDDASTDHTSDIIKEYEKKFPELIKPIYQSVNQYSQHIKINKNFQYPRVRGRYIAFCQGDDCWTDSKKLQIQVDFLENHPDYSGCCHGAVMHNVKNGKDKFLFPQHCSGIVSLDTAFKSGGDKIKINTIVLRKEFLILPECFSHPSVGDYQRVIYLAMNKLYYFNLFMSTYNYGVDGSWSLRNKTTEKRIDNFKGFIKVFHAADEYYKGNYHQFFSEQILEEEFKIDRLMGNYDLLFSDKYKKIRKKLPVKKKLFIMLERHFPKLAHFIKKS